MLIIGLRLVVSRFLDEVYSTAQMSRRPPGGPVLILAVLCM